MELVLCLELSDFGVEFDLEFFFFFFLDLMQSFRYILY
jgi:hypothetical protein